MDKRTIAIVSFLVRDDEGSRVETFSGFVVDHSWAREPVEVPSQDGIWKDYEPGPDIDLHIHFDAKGFSREP